MHRNKRIFAPGKREGAGAEKEGPGELSNGNVRGNENTSAKLCAYDDPTMVQMRSRAKKSLPPKISKGSERQNLNTL